MLYRKGQIEYDQSYEHLWSVIRLCWIFSSLFPVWDRHISFSLLFGLVLLSLNTCDCLLHVILYNIYWPQFWSSYLSVSSHFQLPCSHSYIFHCLPIYCVRTSQYRFSNFITSICHTRASSNILPHDLLNTLYSHHPSHHSHINLCRI